ncbi:MAG: major capsid protein [Planctomycetota bacterium]
MPTTANLLDVIKDTSADPAMKIIDEVSQAVPEVRDGFWLEMPTPYKQEVLVELPQAGHFRKFGQGVKKGKAKYVERLVEALPIQVAWDADYQQGMRYTRGGIDGLLAKRAAENIAGEFQALGPTFFYGRPGDENELPFPGLTSLYDRDDFEIDAGGSEADSATSVWFVKWGPDDTAWVINDTARDGSGDSIDPFTLSVPREETIYDANGDGYLGKRQELLADIGLQVASKRSVARIKNITGPGVESDHDHGVTDSLLRKAMRVFRENGGFMPDRIYMSPRSLDQWTESRTAHNATGTPAPVPTGFEGIPVTETNSVSNTEAIE